MVKSLTERLVMAVKLRPGRSAYQLAQLTGAHPANVSSMLLVMCKQGKLRRVPGQGPGGGYGYHLKEA